MIKARNGKYYWYVPINDIVHSQDRMAIGVAVADSPEGPWKDALGKPLINDSLEVSTWGITNIDQIPHTIDPTVFIDDDAQAHLHRVVSMLRATGAAASSGMAATGTVQGMLLPRGSSTRRD